MNTDYLTSNTKGQHILCFAAVAFEPKKSLKIVQVRVAPPQPGEVRIRILHTAICHTDEYTRSGEDPEGLFPCILGHEATGIVESVGRNVETCNVGDIVIPCYQAECFPKDRMNNLCMMCKGFEAGKTNLCGKIRNSTGRGVMSFDGKSRFTLASDNSTIYHFMGTSTFSEYSVVHQESVAVIDRKADLRQACLLGCGVATGLGAVWNTAKVEPGSSCAVFGIGTVGLAVVEACRLSKAKQIIAVDLNPKKESLARASGATDFICPKQLNENESVLDAVLNRTEKRGADYTFECVGSVHVMRVALEAAAKGWGTSIILGVAGKNQEISTRPFQLITGRCWKGSAFGGWQSRSMIPKLVNMVTDNRLQISKFLTHQVTFHNINDGFDLFNYSDCLRCLISFV